ncbi:hypothetical protein HDE_04065 [Halotydeus destructor]|nr:hypothetical protein HDE_04065 [Halotydeus destructor]
MSRYYTLVLVNCFIATTFAACPNVTIEKIYPCLCFQDTEELYCRGVEGRAIDDDIMQRVMTEVRNGLPEGQRSIRRLVVTQTDITKIDDKLFRGISFSDVSLRYNFRLRKIDGHAFADSRETLTNMSFGEVSSFYETKNLAPMSLDFMRELNLTNLFLSGLNLGYLDETLLKPLLASNATIFLNGIYFQCDCKIKWIFDSLDSDSRSLLVGPPMDYSPRDANLLSCLHPVVGSLIPIRALSMADFGNC